MTYTNEPTAFTGELVSAPTSPRGLQIVRDIALTVAAVLISLAIVYSFVQLQLAANALDDAFPTDPASTSVCTDPNVPWCDPAGD